ncbi:glycosyltransferase family 25 protein [Marinoscillum furvescens]|uniref:Glycosyl transferase family 25 n=1 Tax=Marinoscillum furvescens DSM 4134 TaxID=1122208 RepID=A0A3D9L1R0_MARFU|nr:glycosyltransferase family 25 protein [Marinoscillum furvescens]RED97998.1 glycosyl transferase family 25 [Marinoscillum furvescens DSM 4134]
MRIIKSIFCNNLDRSADRREHMTQLFEALGVRDDVFRFKALHGGVIHNPNNFQKGKIGNLTSQMSIWKYISKQKDGWYLILEDDISLREEFEPSTFFDLFESELEKLPKTIQAIHLTRNQNKLFDKKFDGKTTPYKVLGHVGDQEIRKCSLIFPWSTLTGAYLLTPKAAKRVFRYAFYSVKYAKYLPFKKFNTDVLMTRSLYTSFHGAMVQCFVQNELMDEATNRVSVLHEISIGEDGSKGLKTEVYPNLQYFDHEAPKRLCPWFSEENLGS